MTIYEEAARYRKAASLAAVIETFSGTAEDVAAMPAEGRRTAEKLAAVHNASPETWRLVADILCSRAHWEPKHHN